MKTVWLFLHKTSKIFIQCQKRYPAETSKGAGLIRRALLTLTHASNMLRNFQSNVRDLSSWLTEMSVQAADLNHCKLLWNTPVYLGEFNLDGNTVMANIGITPSLNHFVTLLCDKLISVSWYQTSSIPDISKGASKCLDAKRRYAGILSSLMDRMQVPMHGDAFKELQSVITSVVFWEVLLRKRWKKGLVWMN